MTQVTRGWTLIGERWSSLPEELIAPGNWSQVGLDIGNRSVIPKTTGVYVICSSPPSRRKNRRFDPNDLFGNLYNVIYTGQGNLDQRFASHAGENAGPEIRLARQCYSARLEFWWHRCIATDMDKLEGMLQQCLGPTANRNLKHVPIYVQAGAGTPAFI